MELTPEILLSVAAANPCAERLKINRRKTDVSRVEFGDLVWVEGEIPALSAEFLSTIRHRLFRVGVPGLCLLGKTGYGGGYGNERGSAHLQHRQLAGRLFEGLRRRWVACEIDHLAAGRELGDHLRCCPPTLIVEVHQNVVHDDR